MQLQEIMNTDVVTIGPDEAASAAWARMEREGIRHLIVTEARRLLGVLSERDLGGREGASVRRDRTVRELMTAQVATATPIMTLRQAANLMRSRLIGSLPVVERGEVVGIVTATDVLEELGRGSSRPTVRAKRQSMRLPPAAGRRSAAKAPGGGNRGGRGGQAALESGKGGAAVPVDDSAKITGRITPTLGRERVRQPDSLERAPLPARVARAAKRSAGRTAAPLTPAHIRSVGAVLDAADKEYLRRKLGRKLGRFAPAIERTSVRVEDVNGPRGGIDKRCLIKVVLSGLPSVVVDTRHQSLQAAMDRALGRVERAVRLATERRRMKPRKPRRFAARASASE
ncbi:MAG: CBS domain-containing protein [Burkholderiales bacterium]|nr:CBS domain-containing protein [Burkholderiales bacterium]